MSEEKTKDSTEETKEKAAKTREEELKTRIPAITPDTPEPTPVKEVKEVDTKAKKMNPHVFMEISVEGKKLGRIVIEVF